ncbi:MAG: hypothetical protein ABSH52_12540, partial [Terriglobia bacterium]
SHGGHEASEKLARGLQHSDGMKSQPFSNPVFHSAGRGSLAKGRNDGNGADLWEALSAGLAGATGRLAVGRQPHLVTAPDASR